MAVSPTPEQWGYGYVNATERSGNWSLDPKAPEEFDLRHWLQILSLLISLVGLVGNGLVLWLLGFRIKRNPFSVSILNQAGADAFYLCCYFVITTVDFVPYLHDSSLWLGMRNFGQLSYAVGLNFLAMISTERCLSVLFPIWYRCNRPRHLSASICTLLWTVSILVWLALFVRCYLQQDDSTCHNTPVFIFVWILLLSSLLCVSSLTLLLKVQCTSWCQQPPRLYLLVLLNALIFLLCGIPMGILEFLQFYHEVFMPFWVPLLLASVNSSANPFIYFFMGIQRHRKRKDPLRVILQRALEDQEFGDGARNSPHINMQEASS
ncbi:mas-related G-protein coupled receptor member X1-like [Macrotis lagotis]|uniref:mas-related G-protein coupled receptor member X1-like n=1 Tax=Macrotis lagotis TaxID=92651 RepID=UPI003D69B93A